MSKRMTIELSDKLDLDLQKIVVNPKYNATSKVEILRNSFIIYKLIIDELEEGNTICVVKGRKIIKEFVMSI